jgi:pimeloyl-ACP methyl ester carboxylesterase
MPPSAPRRRRAVAGTVAVALLALLVPAVVRSRAGASGAALHWTACGRAQCATLTVPVDYAQPGGGTFALALARVRATGDAPKLGSLLVNFGGPGEPGTNDLADFVHELPKEIRDRYDVVGFDPRGAGNSRPVRCFDDTIADSVERTDPTPNGEADLRPFYDGTKDPVDVVAACVSRNDGWLAQLGSRNVARDLDRIRGALGDAKLHYLGFSYGTVIGAVYAQMFPDRVGRLVLDGPVDLSATESDQLQLDGNGFEHALDAFLADCAARTACEFHSRDTRGAFVALQQRFEQGLTLPARDDAGRRTNRRANVASFYAAVISSLYDRTFGWTDLATALHDAEQGDGTLLQQLADDYDGRHANGQYDNVDQVLFVILCDDRFDPLESFNDYVAQYHAALATWPLLGGYTGSTIEGCDPRLPAPPPSEQLGDVRVTGTAPILVVGTTEDPATAYSGALDLTARLAGSRLLTFESTEHTAYTKSPCIDRAVDAYLIRGTLPRAGTRCRS